MELDIWAMTAENLQSLERTKTRTRTRTRTF